MIGNWTGCYEFDNNKLRVSTSLDKTYFTLTIDSFNGNSFNGIVNDNIDTRGIKDSWGIIGNIVNKKVFFIKFKPIQSDFGNNESLKLIDKQGPIIYFSGILKDNKMEIS